jgi:uncharacterized protein (UPF0332 family)
MTTPVSHFDPLLWAELAIELPGLQKWSKEARIRTSLGRAYYSLFSAVRVSIRNEQGKGVDVPFRDHGKVIEALIYHGSDAHAAVGKLMEQLYSARQKSDYHLLPDAVWEKKLQKVAFAENMAKQAKLMILRLASLSFASIKERPELN